MIFVARRLATTNVFESGHGLVTYQIPSREPTIAESRSNIDLRKTGTTEGKTSLKADALGAHAEPVGILTGVSGDRDNAVKAVE